MKKHILFFGLLLAQPVLAQPELNEFYTMKTCISVQNLYAKAQIRTVESSEFYTNDSTNVVQKRLEYYQNGQLRYAIVQEPSSADTMSTDTIHYVYLPNGALVSAMPISAYAVSVGYQYDAQGRLSAQLFASAEARDFRFEYDKNGLLSKKIGKAAFPVLDSMGEMQTYWRDVDFFTYQHDAKGRIKSIFVAEFTLTPYTIAFAYDKAGHLTTTTQTLTESKQDTHRTEYFYNTDGILIKITLTDLLTPENSRTILRKVRK